MRDAARPVALLFNARGDYLMNLPALRALAGLWPGRLTLICRPGARRTFFPSLELAAVCEPATVGRGRDGYDFDVEEACEAAAAADLVLSLNPWHGPALQQLIERLRPAPSVGLHPSFDLPLPLDFSVHSAELGFEVARAVDPSLAIEDFAGPPELLEGSERIARQIAGLARPEHVVVAVHADTKPEKTWPPALFAATLAALLQRHPDWIFLDVGERNLGLARAETEDRLVHCGELPLSAALALVGEADLFIGVDSCFLHAADLYGVPAVGLFGPTDPHEFGVRAGPHRHVRAGSEIGAITPAMVIAAAESLFPAR